MDGVCFLSAKRGRMDGLAMGRFSQGSEMKGGMEGSGGGVPLGGKANGGWKSTWLMGSVGSRSWGVWFLLVNSFGCYAGVGGTTG